MIKRTTQKQEIVNKKERLDISKILQLLVLCRAKFGQTHNTDVPVACQAKLFASPTGSIEKMKEFLLTVMSLVIRFNINFYRGLNAMLMPAPKGFYSQCNYGVVYLNMIP